MLKYIKKFQKFWEKNGLETVVIITILGFLIFGLFKKGKGTWSNSYFLNKPELKSNKNQHTSKPDSKGETECREVLEQIFKQPFPKCRPDMLKNSVTGGNYNLELDCYNEKLKIAVEYNGIQHYKYTPHFHKSKDAFENQKYRDYMKRNICEKNGILLIEVPYNIKIENIRNYILDQLRKGGY
jgi:hypothetical protein